MVEHFNETMAHVYSMYLWEGQSDIAIMIGWTDASYQLAGKTYTRRGRNAVRA